MTGAALAREVLLTIGAIPAGSAGSAQVITDAIVIGNNLLDSWASERLMIYETRRELFTLTANTGSFTLGTSGVWNRARPVWFEAAAIVTDPGVAAELELGIAIARSPQEWADLRMKYQTGGYPAVIYPDDAYPLRTVHVSPIPLVGTYKLALYLPTALTAIVATGTDYVFPPGYKEALVYNWALRECLPHARTASDDLKTFARDSVARIKRSNEKPITLGMDPALLSGGRTGNIYAGR